MVVILGKRKSRTGNTEPSVSREEAQAIFQKHFEAQFAPLEPSQPTSETTAAASEFEDLRSDSENDSNDSWDGLSGSESDSEDSPASTTAVEVVEVVAHTSKLPTLSDDPLLKRESKAYLSSRIPSSTIDPSASSVQPKQKSAKAADEDAPSLLKNDLALQRLLSESHLFSGTQAEGSIEHKGRNRHLATDLRLSALGSKASIYKQTKMPMSHRKGITAAVTSRETKRRKEARENGVVLERPSAAGVGKGRSKSRKREITVDAPAVGRLRNGMLKLSEKDIAEIQADSRGSRGKGSRRGGRR